LTTDVPVSVIIPNRDRIAEIGRTLKALEFQTHRHFEVIVVSNVSDILRAKFPETSRAKVISFSEANISAVRNAGIAEAAGDIIAFLDDDAVPEPTWLARLIAPFRDPRVGATGGLVRGRNGVSMQWGPQEVDCFGNDWPLTAGDGWITQPSGTVTTTLGSRKRAYAKARAAAQAGQPTTLFDFSMNARMLTVRFTDDGYWLHKGGIFGRSERKGRMFFFNTFRQRIAQESIRVAVQRVAGLGTRFLPATKSIPKEIMSLVDRPLIQYAIDEARAAGIEEFIFVTSRGKGALEDYFDSAPVLEATLKAKNKTDLLGVLQDTDMDSGAIAYIRQREALGLGHAVWCADPVDRCDRQGD